MNTKQIVIVVAPTALATAALLLVVVRPGRPVPAVQASRESPAVEQELRKLRAQVARIERHSREPVVERREPRPTAATAAPVAEAEEEPPLTEDEKQAAAEELERVEVQRRMDHLHNLMLSEAPDHQAARETEQKLLAVLEAQELERVQLEDVRCFDTLCQADVSFESLDQRNSDFFAFAENIKGSLHARIDDGDSLTGQVYIARGEHDLWESLDE